MNVAATDIAVPGSAVPSLLGMDHRAIVWCYNLLLPLRKIIFTLRNSDPQSTRRRIQHVAKQLALPDNYDYLDSVNRERAAYLVRKSECVWFESRKKCLVNSQYHWIHDRTCLVGGSRAWPSWVSCTGWKHLLGCIRSRRRCTQSLAFQHSLLGWFFSLPPRLSQRVALST